MKLYVHSLVDKLKQYVEIRPDVTVNTVSLAQPPGG